MSQIQSFTTMPHLKDKKPMMNHAWFITGTDTDAGKTIASAALMQAFVKHSYRVTGYKPVASGSKITANGLQNEDALTLQMNASERLSYRQVNPVALLHPTSPHIAGRLESRPIKASQLSSGLNNLRKISDITIVEGAGGWFTPLNEQLLLADWVIKERLPVILVVGIKLGCINHALLTQQAILGADLTFSGWIVNNLQPNYPYYAEYLDTLKTRLHSPFLGEIPFFPNLSSQTPLGQYIDCSLLLS